MGKLRASPIDSLIDRTLSQLYTKNLKPNPNIYKIGQFQIWAIIWTSLFEQVFSTCLTPSIIPFCLSDWHIFRISFKQDMQLRQEPHPVIVILLVNHAKG